MFLPESKLIERMLLPIRRCMPTGWHLQTVEPMRAQLSRLYAGRRPYKKVMAFLEAQEKLTAHMISIACDHSFPSSTKMQEKCVFCEGYRRAWGPALRLSRGAGLFYFRRPAAVQEFVTDYCNANIDPSHGPSVLVCFCILFLDSWESIFPRDCSCTAGASGRTRWSDGTKLSQDVLSVCQLTL